MYQYCKVNDKNVPFTVNHLSNNMYTSPVYTVLSVLIYFFYVLIYFNCVIPNNIDTNNCKILIIANSERNYVLHICA